MNVYDRRSIGNASHTCTIASNLICDGRRTTTRWYCQYLELLKIKGNACASTLHRNVMDFPVERYGQYREIACQAGRSNKRAAGVDSSRRGRRRCDRGRKGGEPQEDD